MVDAFKYVEKSAFSELNLSHPSFGIIMRCFHPGWFLWLSSGSSIFTSKCLIQEGAHPNQLGETQDCFSPLHLSPLLHPHIVLALLAGSSLQSLLSWWQSTKSPGSLFVNSYQVALVYLGLVWWIFVVNQNIGFHIYPLCVSTSWFQSYFIACQDPFEL